MWPISNTGTFISFFQNNGLTQSQCEPLDAAFEANKVEVCEGSPVNFTDMTAGVPITWDWSFEGGTPATSTAENPTVTYNNPGTYNVQLTVHDGVFTTDLLIQDYISVFEYPNTTLDPFDVACIQWPPFPLTGGLPEGGEYSGDYVVDGMFDPATAGVGDHIVFYSYTNEAGCESTAEQTITVDACTGIAENSDKGIKLYPNPATEMVNLISNNQISSIQIFNYIGQLVIEKNVNGNSYQINTSAFESGIYSIKLETEGGTVVKKLIIK